MHSVAIIIPVYNRPKTIVQCLDSIKNQTMVPQQVVVVDDASTDNTLAEVVSWIQTNKDLPYPVECLQMPNNNGVSFARNTGFRHIKPCDSVLFLDSDDIPSTKFLATTTKTLDQQADAIAATVLPGIDDYEEYINYWEASYYMIRCGAAIASNTLFRYTTIKKATGFNDALYTGQDSDLFLKISLLNKLTKWIGLHNCSVQRSIRLDSNQGSKSLSLYCYAYQMRWAFIHNTLRKLVPKSLVSQRLDLYIVMCEHYKRSFHTIERDLHQYFSKLPKNMAHSIKYWLYISWIKWQLISISARIIPYAQRKLSRMLKP